MNKINNILKGSVIALCVVGTIVLLKAVFSGAEFGSVSDWVSSVCNISMAGAAIYAAVNAKDWIKQKKDEDAYKLANEIILNSLYELENTIIEIGISHKQLDSFGLMIDYRFNTLHEYDGFEKVFKSDLTRGKELYTINKSIKQLSRLGWVLKQQPNDVLEKIKLTYDQFHDEHSNLWRDIRSNYFNIWTNPPSPITLKERLVTLAKLEEEFNHYYYSFDQMYKTFDEYFDKSNVKK